MIATIRRYFLLPASLLVMLLCGWKFAGNTWISEQHKGYLLVFTAADSNNTKTYSAFIDKGMAEVKTFFKVAYKTSFSIYIHPNRQLLDSTWQKDWGMPGFKSECWMVASGVAKRLDMISPKTWDTASCEHKYGETIKTQQLITHELVHVFHGQLNASPDFSNTDGMDWFVEGLATYASGQCTAERITEIKKAIAENTVPASLDDFWKGKLKYGLSASVVMFIDKKYGRKKLQQLLPLNKKVQLLDALSITETGLLQAWQNYLQQL